MKIYLAASFAFPDKETTEERKAIISKAALSLRNRGFDVFVPHEHKIPDAEKMDNLLWSACVMAMDKGNIDIADWVVVLTFGKAGNNAGVAWEAGYAYGIGKNVLIVKMNNEIESMMMWFNAHSKVMGLEGLEAFDFDNNHHDSVLSKVTLS